MVFIDLEVEIYHKGFHVNAHRIVHYCNELLGVLSDDGVVPHVQTMSKGHALDC